QEGTAEVLRIVTGCHPLERHRNTLEKVLVHPAGLEPFSRRGTVHIGVQQHGSEFLGQADHHGLGDTVHRPCTDGETVSGTVLVARDRNHGIATRLRLGHDPLTQLPVFFGLLCANIRLGGHRSYSAVSGPCGIDTAHLTRVLATRTRDQRGPGDQLTSAITSSLTSKLAQTFCTSSQSSRASISRNTLRAPSASSGTVTVGTKFTSADS